MPNSTSTPVSLGATRDLALQLRVDSIRASTSAGSGHPTSSMSAADIVAVLATRHLRYDWDSPELASNDHLIFSKGHASPLLYALYRAVGVIDEDELLMEYRRFGARLQGHPTPILPWVDVATGSLGQGLPVGVGIALAEKYLERTGYRTWVLCGDSELAEGSIWEALDKAHYYRLSNLIVIVDVNRLGQRGETDLGWDLATYEARAKAFGAKVFVVDGHSIEALDELFGQVVGESANDNRPTVILAKTVKGSGFSEVENKDDWHGKPLPGDMADRAIVELGGTKSLRLRGPLPHTSSALTQDVRSPAPRGAVDRPVYDVGELVAPRYAFGQSLEYLGSINSFVVALDAEVSNSTYASLFAKHYPERFFEMFIAEQQMVAAATGLAVRGYVAFSSTFAAFLTRAFDFIRMAGISRVPLRLVGTHAGIEIGPDGPSQMALEDLAMMTSVFNSVVLYPSDGTSAARLTELMAELQGISYLRATRGSYPVLYGRDEIFTLGGSKTLVASGDDQVTLLAAGVTVHESLAAAERLRSAGISARVIDCYSVKPLDEATVIAAARVTSGRIVVAEDHRAHGGLGAAVAMATTSAGVETRIKHLAVEGLPGSGTSAELLAWAGINAESIARAATELLT